VCTCKLCISARICWHSLDDYIRARFLQSFNVFMRVSDTVIFVFPSFFLSIFKLYYKKSKKWRQVGTLFKLSIKEEGVFFSSLFFLFTLFFFLYLHSF